MTQVILWANGALALWMLYWVLRTLARIERKLDAITRTEEE